MPLIIEDGSIVANAESYASVAAADTYWTNRNDTVWGALTTAAKEAALRQAALYMDKSYRWVGSRVDVDQVMNWPRWIDYRDWNRRRYISTEIPDVVIKAQCELAYEAAVNGTLDPTLSRGNVVTQETVGPITVRYAESPGVKQFPFVEKILSEVILGGPTSLSMDAVRA